MPSIYNHEMCHHWLTARKMKGWPLSDETKLSNDFGLCASWGVEISISRLLSTFVNIAAPRSSIVNILIFLGCSIRRGNLTFRIAIKMVQYCLGNHLLCTFFILLGCLPQSWRGEEIGVGAPPTIISLWWQLLLLCRKASHLPLPLLSGRHHSDHCHHHHYHKFPQSSITFLFSMINHPNQKATAWKKILMVLPLAYHPNQTLGLDQVSLAI